LITFLVLLFANFVSCVRPGAEVYARPPKPEVDAGRDGHFAVEEVERVTEDGDAGVGTEDDEERKNDKRHGMGPISGKQAAIEPRNRRHDPLEGMYFHDSEQASQLVEREARKIDQEATKAEGKAKNVTSEISKYDKKLKDLLKSLRRLAKKQQAYATQVNTEYMDKEYGPEGRLQAFTDFDLQKVRPFGEMAKEEAKKVLEAATIESDTESMDAEQQRTVDTLANAEKTARLAQKLATKLAAQAGTATKRDSQKKRNKKKLSKTSKKRTSEPAVAGMEPEVLSITSEPTAAGTEPEVLALTSAPTAAGTEIDNELM